MPYRTSGFSMDALAEAETRDMASIHALAGAKQLLEERTFQPSAGARGNYGETQHERRLQQWSEFASASSNPHANLSAVQWEKQIERSGPADSQQRREVKKQLERQAYLAERERHWQESQQAKSADAQILTAAGVPRYLQASLMQAAAAPSAPQEEWLSATQDAYKSLAKNGPAAQPVAAGGYRKPQAQPPPPPSHQLRDVQAERDEQRAHARAEFAAAQEERAQRNWRSSIVLGDDSTASQGRSPSSMYQTSSSSAALAMTTTHLEASRRAEEAVALKELIEQFGYSPEEARYEIAAYRRETTGQGQVPPRPPTVASASAPPVPNFLKRQMALEQGHEYTPQRADGSLPGVLMQKEAARHVQTSYPRANLSSVSGGIFGHYQ